MPMWHVVNYLTMGANTDARTELAPHAMPIACRRASSIGRDPGNYRLQGCLSGCRTAIDRNRPAPSRKKNQGSMSKSSTLARR